MSNEGTGTQSQNFIEKREVASQTLAEAGDELKKTLEGLDILVSTPNSELLPEEQAALEALGSRLDLQNVPTF